jgi:hypothetical protein
MKRVLLMMSCAVLLGANDEASFQTDMKAVDEHSGVLRKLSARTGDEAATRAEKIATLYDGMRGFWEKRNVADAVKWSEEGKTAAVELASAAKAGDASKAEASFKLLGGTCRQCHTAHREKLPDGTYKIK